MSRRKRITGKAEEMRQVAQVLRQSGLEDTAVRAALLAMCGVDTQVIYKDGEVVARMKSRLREEGPTA